MTPADPGCSDPSSITFDQATTPNIDHVLGPTGAHADLRRNFVEALDFWAQYKSSTTQQDTRLALSVLTAPADVQTQLARWVAYWGIQVGGDVGGPLCDTLNALWGPLLCTARAPVPQEQWDAYDAGARLRCAARWRNKELFDLGFCGETPTLVKALDMRLDRATVHRMVAAVVDGAAAGAQRLDKHLETRDFWNNRWVYFVVSLEAAAAHAWDDAAPHMEPITTTNLRSLWARLSATDHRSHAFRETLSAAQMGDAERRRHTVQAVLDRDCLTRLIPVAPDRPAARRL